MRLNLFVPFCFSLLVLLGLAGPYCNLDMKILYWWFQGSLQINHWKVRFFRQASEETLIDEIVSQDILDCERNGTNIVKINAKLSRHL